MPYDDQRGGRRHTRARLRGAPRPDIMLPPYISTGDPGSFAGRTITERKPKIIAQVLECAPLPAQARGALQGLARELREGTVSMPFGGHGLPPVFFGEPERAAWETEIAKYEGRSWLDVPWYFAESFFYLKLLAAVGYFEGPLAGRDPFEPLKRREMEGPDGGMAVARRILCEAEGLAGSDALPLFLSASLWGNRADLSACEVDPSLRRGILDHTSGNLVVDHTERALDAIRAGRAFHFILDNAGPELACDLLLASRLLGSGERESGGRSAHAAGSAAEHPTVILHVKAMPFFVSDAMAKDVDAAIAGFEADGDPRLADAGRMLRGAGERGALQVRGHWFWASPLHFTGMPLDIRGQLAGADLVIIKGDANYRRILEDRRWRPWDSMDRIASYFPAPFVSLRTMKAEIVVDIPRWKARRIARQDPEWRVSGKRGIVRYCRPRG